MIHLTTVIGGYVTTLPFMLRHYLGLGIASFLVNVHLSTPDDPILDQVESVTAPLGVEVNSVTVGPWHAVERDIYERSRMRHPNDWFLLADQDEFHRYPTSIDTLTRLCDEKGYDHVSGCFIDRVASDGSLIGINYSKRLEAQFPLGAQLTYSLAGGNPLKIVLARGNVKLQRGQHSAQSGRGCPIEDAFVQVHHYKWIAGLTDALKRRAIYHRSAGMSYWKESARIVEYFDRREGKIDLKDPRFLVAPCHPEYKYWPYIRRRALSGRNSSSYSSHSSVSEGNSAPES